MPLNLSVNDGDFTPFMKYNAKAGRFYVRAESATEETEITNPLLAFDMANIRTGWIYYSEGTGPQKVWDPSLEMQAVRPPGPLKWKRGFEVMVFGNALIPGTSQKIGVREFSSTAGNVIGPMLRMYAEYEAGMRMNADKVPVYACTGVKPITGVHGVNYEPLFSLRQWVERSRIPEFVKPEPQPKPATDNGSDSFGHAME